MLPFADPLLHRWFWFKTTLISVAFSLINSIDSIGWNQHYHKYSMCPETWLIACIMKLWKTKFLICWNNSLVGSTVFQLNLFAHRLSYLTLPQLQKILLCTEVYLSNNQNFQNNPRENSTHLEIQKIKLCIYHHWFSLQFVFHHKVFQWNGVFLFLRSQKMSTIHSVYSIDHICTPQCVSCYRSDLFFWK